MTYHEEFIQLGTSAWLTGEVVFGLLALGVVGFWSRALGVQSGLGSGLGAGAVSVYGLLLDRPRSWVCTSWALALCWA